MSLGNFADIASIASAFIGILGLLGLGLLVHKFIFKQENSNITINGDVTGDVHTSNTSKIEANYE